MLNGSQIHWTNEVEEAIKNNTLPAYIQKCKEELINVVKMDR